MENNSVLTAIAHLVEDKGNIEYLIHPKNNVYKEGDKEIPGVELKRRCELRF